MKLLGLFLTLFTGLSVYAADTAVVAPLSFGTHDNSVYLINATTKSCFAKTDTMNPTAADNVPAKYFQISNFFVSWMNPSLDLRVAALRIDLKSPNFPGGMYTAMLAGDEVASLDGSHGQWNMVLPRSGRGVTFSSSCAPTFGSVAIVAGQDVNFSATGTMTLIGFTRDYQGREMPYQVSAPLTVYNMAATPAPVPAQ